LWAALLEVKGDPSLEYEHFLNENDDSTDRQVGFTNIVKFGYS
jgi:hypothetical protein